MNAISFLIKEHNKVRRNFQLLSKKIQRYDIKIKKFSMLCHDLLIHEAMEHQVWYPHFKNNKNLKNEVKHLLSEEKHAHKLIKGFKSVKTEKEWNNKFTKFKKAVEHHAKEEESKLFPHIKELLSLTELREIGKTMSQFKNKHNRNKI